MKICDVVQDLIPLYCDEVASESSREMVDEHIKDCAVCQELLAQMKDDDKLTTLSVDNIEINALRKMKRKITKKTAVITIFAVAFTLAFAIITIQYVNNIRLEDNARHRLLSYTWASTSMISRHMDRLFENIENEITDVEENMHFFIMMSQEFAKLDAYFDQYNYNFTSIGFVMPDFRNIGYMLTAGVLVFRERQYYGILADGTISENEIRYLMILREDISLISENLTSPDNPYHNNENLSIHHLNQILEDFYSKWSLGNENSPIFILQSN